MATFFYPVIALRPNLLPPSLTDWLPQNPLAWFVLDAVEQMDLQPFYQKYHMDGVGNSAFDPSMMVALLLYAYCPNGSRHRRSDVKKRIETDNRV